MHCLKKASIIVFSLFLVSRVSSKSLWERTLKDYGQCPFTNAVETGRIKDSELKETSGLVASHKNYGVFYAIQDSLNPDPVYAINQEGDLLGRFEMEGVDMFDFEDIALGPGPEGPDGPDYIYIGDIGNNWDGHCRGINADDYVVYRIPEPDVDALRGDKKVVIPAADVTKMVLTVPDGPTECDDEAKIDFETLMIDPIFGDIYLIQKNIFSTDASIYKFTPEDTTEKTMLQNVGKMRIPEVNGQQKMAPVKDKSADDYCRGVQWPMCLNAGDISRDGKILIRNYEYVQEWYREPEQTIESALTENTFCDFPLEYEILGESLAIKSDATGFYTTSDWQENAPIYSYHFKC